MTREDHAAAALAWEAEAAAKVAALREALKAAEAELHDARADVARYV